MAYPFDDNMDGLKRGAEKFGTGVAKKVVKRYSTRVNGFAPKEAEPYGAGMGGADTEQESGVPTQALNDGEPHARLRQRNKLDFLLRDLALTADPEDKRLIQAEIDSLKLELDAMPDGDPDARQEKDTSVSGPRAATGLAGLTAENDGAAAGGGAGAGAGAGSQAAPSGGAVDSAKLGYDSRQKTTTEVRGKRKLEEKENASAAEELLSRCPACGLDQGAWTGKCLGCGVENAEDVGGNLVRRDNQSEEAGGASKDDVAAENAAERTCDRCDGSGVAGDALCPNCAGTGKVGSRENAVSDPRFEACPVCHEKLSSDTGDHESRLRHHLQYNHDLSTGKAEMEIDKIKRRDNAGHLSAAQWDLASLDERAGWLEASSCDVELAASKFIDLSLDVQVALQRAWDAPASANNGFGEQRLSAAKAAQGHDMGELVNPLLNGFSFSDPSGAVERVEASTISGAWRALSARLNASEAEMRAAGIRLNAEQAKCDRCGHAMKSAQEHERESASAGCTADAPGKSLCGCPGPRGEKQNAYETGPKVKEAMAEVERLKGLEANAKRTGSADMQRQYGESVLRALKALSAAQKEEMDELGIEVHPLKKNASFLDGVCYQCNKPMERVEDGGDRYHWWCGGCKLSLPSGQDESRRLKEQDALKKRRNASDSELARMWDSMDADSLEDVLGHGEFTVSTASGRPHPWAQQSAGIKADFKASYEDAHENEKRNGFDSAASLKAERDALKDHLDQLTRELHQIEGGDGAHSHDSEPAVKQILARMKDVEREMKAAHEEYLKAHERGNDGGAAADVEQIESLAEGILHEAEELEGSGVENAGLSCEDCGKALTEQTAATVDAHRAGKALCEQCYHKRGMRHSSDRICPKCGIELQNKDISKGDIGEEIAHHIRDKGMDPKQAEAAAYSESRHSVDPRENTGIGVAKGASKYGGKK